MKTKVLNIAQLRTRKGSSGALAETLGYYTASDEGGNTYQWNASSTLSDNGGSVIAVTGVSVGRWISVNNQEIYLSWFENSNTGFQNFLNASAGKTGILNRNATLTATMNIPGDTTLTQNKGTLITTSALVGFYWNLKKNFIGTGLNWTSTCSTVGATILKFEGMWNATFNTCVFDLSASPNSTGTDVMQILPGLFNGNEYWGTYFCDFHDCKFAAGRYICKADGFTYPSFVTNISFSFCWATGGQTFIKATHADNFNFHRSTADSLSGHAFDLVSCANFILEPNEVYVPDGFFVLNEDSACNKNVVVFTSRVNPFTSNTGDWLGTDNSKLTLQGSNSNGDFFRTRLNSVFSYNGSTLLQGKGGTNTWTDILLWSETKGLELRAGWNNWFRIKEARSSKGVNDQIKTYIKTMTATSGQFQDLIYISTPSANNSITADITIHYKSNDNTVAVIQKILFVQTCNASNVTNYSMAVTDALIVGTTVVPVINTFYSGSLGTVAITHANVALAATMDIEIKYSSTTNATLS